MKRKRLSAVLTASAMFASAVGANCGAMAAGLPQPCQDGAVAVIIKELETAARFYKDCYEDPAAAIDGVVYARYQRATILQSLNLHAEALAEFSALLDPALASSSIWDRRAKGSEKLGATRALVAVKAARVALGLGDAGQGLAYAELALRESEKDHRVHLDVRSEAYMLRARMRAQDANQQSAAAADIVRAYVRGNEDQWVVETVKAFAPADLAKIEDLRARLSTAYAKYLGYYAVSATLNLKLDRTLAEAAAAGDALYAGILSDEAALVGSDATTAEN